MIIGFPFSVHRQSINFCNHPSVDSTVRICLGVTEPLAEFLSDVGSFSSGLIFCGVSWIDYFVTLCRQVRHHFLQNSCYK